MNACPGNCSFQGAISLLRDRLLLFLLPVEEVPDVLDLFCPD